MFAPVRFENPADRDRLRAQSLGHGDAVINQATEKESSFKTEKQLLVLSCASFCSKTIARRCPIHQTTLDATPFGFVERAVHQSNLAPSNQMLNFGTALMLRNFRTEVCLEVLLELQCRIGAIKSSSKFHRFLRTILLCQPERRVPN